jgi:hypothetical protein
LNLGRFRSTLLFSFDTWNNRSLVADPRHRIGPNTATLFRRFRHVRNLSYRPARIRQVRQAEQAYPDFPLFPHAPRRWAKKIRGVLHYFGPWDDPDGALRKHLEQRDDLHAGRKPHADLEALSVKELCNRFLTAKQALVDEGRLSPLTCGDYKTACDEVIAAKDLSRTQGIWPALQAQLPKWAELTDR